jgi:undecaprenyl-diphosphatase
LEIIDAIILGIIQGLTEFLPVSSSGHLELGKAILGDDSIPEESLLFTVVLHFATALSTIVVFRKDVLDIFKGLFQFKWNEEAQFAIKIIISMIPAAIVGFFLEDFMEVAMLPGISRSGATISTSVLLGIDKTKSARFSFLMVVPLIFGKVAKDILGGELSFESAQMGAMGAGFAAAFIAGLFACTWMIQLVKKSKLSYFAIYCLIVGLIAIAWSIWG